MSKYRLKKRKLRIRIQRKAKQAERKIRKKLKIRKRPKTAFIYSADGDLLGKVRGRTWNECESKASAKFCHLKDWFFFEVRNAIAIPMRSIRHLQKKKPLGIPRAFFVGLKKASLLNYPTFFL